jgi:hypothetical protein
MKQTSIPYACCRQTIHVWQLIYMHVVTIHVDLMIYSCWKVGKPNIFLEGTIHNHYYIKNEQKLKLRQNLTLKWFEKLTWHMNTTLFALVLLVTIVWSCADKIDPRLRRLSCIDCLVIHLGILLSVINPLCYNCI